MKKHIIIVLIAALLVACTGCGPAEHKHSFGEWETKSPATCGNAEVEVRKCECGEEETREGDPATGNHNMVAKSDDANHWTACDNEGCDEATEKAPHSAVSISAVSNLDNPQASSVVTAGDLTVTAVCECGKTYTVTDGITLEGATLTAGENTVTVQYGGLSAEVIIEAEKFAVTLKGTVTDDTYVSSENADKKNEDLSGRTEMGTISSSFRIYLRANISDILADESFQANKDDAKVHIAFTISSGELGEEPTFILKAYAPTDVAFSEITWNSVNNKEDAMGEYSQLHWSNGKELVAAGVGEKVSVDGGKITFTFNYSEIADYVDANGNILLAFGTKDTNKLKVASTENSAAAPVITVTYTE